MKLFDFIGLKNFRVFDDQKGIIEELSNINLLTGTNNSGKSSILKSLQMLKNSAGANKNPFDLDLTEQQHLLGDFDNVLYNNSNKNIQILLPFPFLGLTKMYAEFSFNIPEKSDGYKAHLRKINIIDKTDNCELFSFAYRKATTAEIDSDNEEYRKKLQQHQEKNKEKEQLSEYENFFGLSDYMHPPSHLAGFIDYKINIEKLRNYLTQLLPFYQAYLKERNKEDFIRKCDARTEKTFFAASIFANTFKSSKLEQSWAIFLEKSLKEKPLLKGRQRVSEEDFDGEDYFIPPYEIEDILNYYLNKILDNTLEWKNVETNKGVISHCFESSYRELVKKISNIHYLSTVKEENSRIYLGTNSSPFINLLKDYSSLNIYHGFLNKYLQAFEIGTEIKVDYDRKYQTIKVSILNQGLPARDLVDFGYGIKQLILILIQISVLAEKNSSQREVYMDYGELGYENYYQQSILLVEEPETNLHPKWQSLLAEMFVEANKAFNIQLIIETHSEYLIRKFQTLTAAKEIESGSIKIFYLRSTKNNTVGRNQLETTFIEKDGSIDFTIFDGGFFDVNHKLEDSLLNIQRDHFFTEFKELKAAAIGDSIKINELQQKVDLYTDKADLRIYQQIISAMFDTSKLRAETTVYLTSAQFLIKNINATNDDFSPVILQYGRAIEHELLCFFKSVIRKKWSFAQMQGVLEKFKFGTTSITPPCTNREITSITAGLLATFNNSGSLKIELLADLRKERNEVAHPGITKAESEALNYVIKANDFLREWTQLKK